MPTWSVIDSDCIEAMRQMPENTFDAVVCDPPYHLTSSKSVARGEVPKEKTREREQLGLLAGLDENEEGV